jgi:hypothetical protein
MGYDHSLGIKEFLDQLNLHYICIMSCDHSLGRKKVLTFIYCFMILFLIVYILNIFLLFVPFSQQGSAIMFLF